MIIIIIILLILIILSSMSWNNPESAVQIISKLVATELEPSHRVIVVIANIISVITSALSVIIIHTSAIPIIDIIIASKQLCMKPPIHPHHQHKGRIDTATKGKKRYPLVTPPNIHLIWYGHLSSQHD